MKRRVWASVVGAVSVLATGCSSDEGAAPVTAAPVTSAPVVSAAPAPLAAACAIVTLDALRDAFGQAFQPGVPRGGAGWISEQCEWAGASGTYVSLALGTRASFAAQGIEAPLDSYVQRRRQDDERQFPIVALDPPGGTGYIIANERQKVALVGRDDIVVQVLVVASSAVPVEAIGQVTLAALDATRN